MNVVWGRFSQYVNLSSLKGYQGFQEERWSIFKELIRRGHKVKILTPMTKESEKLLKDVKDKKITHEGILDITWMRKLKYNPLGFCDEDDDVLVFEAGPPNVLFYDRYIKGWQIRRCANICNSFKGLLIFSQNDPDLPMSLWKMGCSKYPWSHKRNPYRIESKDNTFDEGKYKLKNYPDKEDYGWADFDEIFKDKRVVLMTKSLCPEKVAQTYNASRSRYVDLVNQGLLHVEGMPTAYAEEYVNHLNFNEDPEFDVVYTGYCRNREKYFAEYFTQLPKRIKRAVTGPWNEKRKVMLDKRTECMGLLDGFMSMPEFSNSSRSVLQLAVKKAKQYDWVTSRHLEAVFSGCICFYDHEYSCMEQYLGDEFAVKDANDARKKYLWIRGLNANSRYNLWKYQWELCKNYSWVWYVDRFEKLCKKHGACKSIRKEFVREPMSAICISKQLKRLRA